MPTKTRRQRKLSTHTMYVHVPVDMIMIEKGPNASLCEQYDWQLNRAPSRWEFVRVWFTMSTAASSQTFLRHVEVYTIFGINLDGSFSFTGGFCNKTVSGVFNPRTGKGWFNED